MVIAYASPVCGANILRLGRCAYQAYIHPRIHVHSFQFGQPVNLWPCKNGLCSQSVQPVPAYLQLAMPEKYCTDSVQSLHIHTTCIHAIYTRNAVPHPVVQD